MTARGYIEKCMLVTPLFCWDVLCKLKLTPDKPQAIQRDRTHRLLVINPAVVHFGMYNLNLKLKYVVVGD